MRFLKTRPVRPIVLLLFVGGLLMGLTPAFSTPAAAQSDPAADKSQKEDERAREREARIEEYLRKKEERRARRALQQELKAQERAEAEAAKAQAAPVEAVEAPRPRRGKNKQSRSVEPAAAAAVRDEEWIVELPREIERIHKNLRRGGMANDPTVQSYLALIERGEASPYQLAAFGNFLGQNGMTREALEYYGIALDLEDEDPVLWLNAGTLHRTLGEYSIAAEVYGRALDLDGSNAFAHYNLGAVLDEMGDYEGSVEAYKVALTLDPSLGDPTMNPQAANNERMLAVRLMLYHEQAGSRGLPLLDLPAGGVDPQANDSDR